MPLPWIGKALTAEKVYYLYLPEEQPLTYIRPLNQVLKLLLWTVSSFLANGSLLRSCLIELISPILSRCWINSVRRVIFPFAKMLPSSLKKFTVLAFRYMRDVPNFHEGFTEVSSYNLVVSVRNILDLFLHLVGMHVTHSHFLTVISYPLRFATCDMEMILRFSSTKNFVITTTNYARYKPARSNNIHDDKGFIYWRNSSIIWHYEFNSVCF